jgi:hypothetical protein
MNKGVIIGLIAAAFSMVACGTSGTLFTGMIKPITVEELDAELRAQQITFETFSAKSKVDISSSTGNQSFSASIDIRRDSLIGISLRLLGVEGARIRITPDSIEILDRLNQVYMPRDYSFLRDSLNLDLNFFDLQNLIIGNPVMYDSTTLELGSSEEFYILNASKGVYKNQISMAADFSIVRMFIQDLYAKRNLTLQYAEYDKIGGKRFALNRNILLDAREDLTANIIFTNVEFDQPFEFSFSVNPKYKVD